MGGVTPGSYGSKLISVIHSPADGVQRPSHQGVVMLFDIATGEPAAVIEAGSVTAIRTAAASAMATDALARRDSSVLGILGYGEQAHGHAQAICAVRPISKIRIWGRDAGKAAAMAAQLGEELGVAGEAASSPADCARGADIVCTTTAAAEPLLHSEDIAPGTHLNVVGSSRAGPSEIDTRLVAAARFFGDNRESVLSQGAEFINARTEGLVADDHFLGEIGEVLLGRCEGRRDDCEITIYKSLGHIVQDLAAAQHVVDRAIATGRGVRASL
jgi:ornithine cyclodeaminase